MSRQIDKPKSSPKPMRKNLSVLNDLPGPRFSVRPLKFRAWTATNRPNLLSIKHFLHPAFYSAVASPFLAAAL
jgi:hypothetical protein